MWPTAVEDQQLASYHLPQKDTYGTLKCSSKHLLGEVNRLLRAVK
jgi:hypothetical protein